MKTTIEVKAGESILDTAINHDVPLQHACGGFCACTTCQVVVHQGMENLSSVEEEEAERLERAAKPIPNSRLGCQSKIMGDVVVEIVNEDI
jgi:2Fe-2S ferredoxin